MSSFHQGSGNRGASVLHFKKRKSRFSYREIQVLLEEVRKNRNIVIGKFNRGVSTEVKKRTWADITARINEVSQCPREIIEVIKKWSDLKCDTKRKVAALRAGGPVTGGRARLSRELTPVESVVHQILQLASLRAPLPLEAGPYLGLGVRLGHSDRQGPARAEQEGEPDEEEEVVVGMPSSSSSSAPLAGPGNCIPPAPQALPIPVSLPMRAQAAAHKEELAEPTPVYCIASHEEPTSSPYELQYEISVDDHDVESIDSEEEHRDDSRPHFLPHHQLRKSAQFQSLTAHLPHEHQCKNQAWDVCPETRCALRRWSACRVHQSGLLCATRVPRVCLDPLGSSATPTQTGGMGLTWPRSERD
nr:PREDICTED: myb-related transcription factor, partner of profilin-like [Lepisosteus oculatus]